MTAVHAPVLPAEHDAGCRRGLDPALPFYALDRERCERCRNLWAALDAAHAQLMERRRRPA